MDALVFLMRVLMIVIVIMFFAFFFSLVTDVLLQTFVEFLDPTFYTAEVEGLEALLAIPNGASLVNLVLADNTLLAASRK